MPFLKIFYLGEQIVIRTMKLSGMLNSVGLKYNRKDDRHKASLTDLNFYSYKYAHPKKAAE
jgi:hypothetical protein